MRKLGLFIVFLLLALSLPAYSYAYADEGDLDGDGDGETIESESEVKTSDDKVFIEQKLRMVQPVEVDKARILPAALNTACQVDPALQRELYDLNTQVMKGKESGEDVSDLKSKIELLTKDLMAQKEACVKESAAILEKPVITTTKADPVMAGTVCEVSEDLKESLLAYKEKYMAAIAAKDFETSKTIREEAARIEQNIQEERRKCLQENVPGIVRQEVRECMIPAEVHEKLEKTRHRVSELKNLGEEIPEDLRKELSELESRIAEYKAKCNALKVTSDVKESDLRDYYSKRMSEALANDDPDVKVEELRELRREIDETIKNLIEEKKKLRFDEVNGLVDEVKFRPKSTSIGDSETEEDVEVEVEVEGSDVTITSNDENVVLTEGDLEFTADDITVDENGIYVDGVLVKKLPKAVFEHNKNFERNAKRFTELRLEKDGEKAVYKAKYESRRKLFGFIGVNSKQESIVDAETGDTISEKKPWWNGLSKEAEEESDVEAEVSEDDTDTSIEAETEVVAEAEVEAEATA